MSKNVEVVAALYEAFVRRDMPAIQALIDPEATVSQTEQLPWGGQGEGPSGLQSFTQRLLSHVDSRVEVEEYVEAGDDVIAIGRTRGTVRATGAPFDIRAVHVWTVKDGRAVRFHAFINTPEMLRVLG